MFYKNPSEPAKACIIWMHGLGADAQDMMGLASQLHPDFPVRHVFLEAPVRPVTMNNSFPMRAWFDIYGLDLKQKEDREGILQSEKIIQQAVMAQEAEGFSPNKIFLAGFSQGGMMALFTGLRKESSLAGIIALSAAIPLAFECEIHLNTNTPIFLGAGKFDPLVLPAWSRMSHDLLQDKGFSNLSWHEYDMEHSVCMQEINDLSDWLSKQGKNL